MKADRYTKIVLTIIAIALICLVIQNTDFITPAQAACTDNLGGDDIFSYGEVIDVRIVGTSGNIPVDLRTHGIYSSYEAVPVKIIE